MGPTASGKTGLAVELAQRLPVEIISVDSALVYRDMDIGTAKPDAATLAAAPHHLIDLIDPTGVYSAARFCDDALALMADITARGRVPLLVGGTMLYFKALREGLTDLPQADAGLREVIEAEAADRGWPALHAELARLDPESGARLQPTDTQRIQRALEVVRLTGRPMSDYWRAGRAAALPYQLLQIALVPADRALLHERIAQRFDAMLGAGLIEEVRALREKYPLDAAMPSMRCVGYRQVWDYLEGGYGRDEMRDRGIFATRQLAKRQLTWLRGMQDIIQIEPGRAEAGQKVLSMVTAELAR
ncbi:tRNA (adenosine(37)-N6)-dimethylallyltransferase MiaA [Sulfuriferula sp. GW1]|uniref:tRNA (adenosine(37)-N6)-dimethylallyltransferase MiaA n=1 Tax=Sulfuriferula sp. GW1 TaxID=3345111 RepID=UPI0039AE9D49